MASFRRASSMPAHHLGDSAAAGEEESPHAIAAPLISKSFQSGHSDNPLSLFPRSFGSLDYALYKVEALVHGFFPKRSGSTRPAFDRLKSLKFKGNNIIWRRAILHFLAWFLLGAFIGFSFNFLTQTDAFYNEKLHLQREARIQNHGRRSPTTIVTHNNTSQSLDHQHQHHNGGDRDASLTSFNPLLIIVTQISGRPLEAYYVNRLAATLKLVPPPLLWVVAEMAVSQSAEVAEALRKSGVMFRHLVCEENLAEIDVDRGMYLRNAALSHVEQHSLDGIVFFANYDNIYTLDLFDQMRKIRRFGTWTVAEVGKEEANVVMEGPVCNGSKVIGWHTKDIMTNKYKRFHAGTSGFAFNSTILWDPKRWNKPSLKPVRFLYTVKEVFQVSTFIGQIVEDESQMEGLPIDCSRIMVWQFNVESLYAFLPRKNSVLPFWSNGMNNLPL